MHLLHENKDRPGYRGGLYFISADVPQKKPPNLY